MRLIRFSQFDTVYHEHFSYLSLVAVRRIFEAAGLRLFNVQENSQPMAAACAYTAVGLRRPRETMRPVATHMAEEEEPWHGDGGPSI